MKLVCAWCRKHISGDPKDTEVSHGICARCAKSLMLEKEDRKKRRKEN